MNTEDTATIEALIEDLEPAIVRAQFRAATRRLSDYLELLIERDGAQAARALLEKMALIAGDRRTKTMSVSVERRRA
jgi:hypothetical protein